MSARESDLISARGSLKRQIPSFVAIGAFGYVVDTGVTYSLFRIFGVDPLFARLPAFVVATVINFGLNRAFTFADSNTPLIRAFVRYVMVCAAGLVVNYAVYASTITISKMFGYPVTPSNLAFFIACGTGVATFVTFLGFRFFAFRN